MKNLFYITIVLILIVSCNGTSKFKEYKRNGISYVPIMFRFEYDESVESRVGIPSGAKSYRTDGDSTVGEPILIASGREMVDEDIKGENMRLIKVNYSYPDISGKEVAKSLAWFRPKGLSYAYVVKTLLNDQYQSNYNWTGFPGFSLATVETIDIKTGEKVHETKNLGPAQDSNEAFQGTELYYSDGKIICETSFVRHVGTGLLISESFIKGKLPYDYHTYEFVMSGWPAGQ